MTEFDLKINFLNYIKIDIVLKIGLLFFSADLMISIKFGMCGGIVLVFEFLLESIQILIYTLHT